MLGKKISLGEIANANTLIWVCTWVLKSEQEKPVWLKEVMKTITEKSHIMRLRQLREINIEGISLKVENLKMLTKLLPCLETGDLDINVIVSQGCSM